MSLFFEDLIFKIFFFTLIKETATVPCLMLFFRVLQILWTYWWGRTKTKISASLVASRRSGTATCNQERKVRTKKVCLSCSQNEKGWSNMGMLLLGSNIQISTSHTVYVKHAVTTPHIVQQTTFSGSLMPGRYLTFSCSVLTISVSFLPSIISSYMYILTSGLNFSFLSTTFFPRILAIADPLTKKFPLTEYFNLSL